MVFVGYGSTVQFDLEMFHKQIPINFDYVLFCFAYFIFFCHLFVTSCLSGIDRATAPGRARLQQVVVRGISPPLFPFIHGALEGEFDLTVHAPEFDAGPLAQLIPEVLVNA
jgi:hypothetical protein